MLPRSGIHANTRAVLFTFYCAAIAAVEATRRWRGLPPIPWP